ncbi:MAG: response regulator [Candidatus Helarchaeota archaeon]
MDQKILIVDDEADTVRLAKKLLETKGYKVKTAYNGEEALKEIQKMQNNLPNLILLDIKMPKKDGFEVCKRIKEDQKLKKIKIVVFTAKIFDKDRELAYQLGADEYITKPFSGEELIKIIEKMLHEK